MTDHNNTESTEAAAKPAVVESMRSAQTSEPGDNSNSAASEPDSASLMDASLMPAQEEMPFALVQGEPLTELPKDLYIPPAALQVILEAFEGPLDLLLYLIRRQNLDILAINVASITEQYMQYVEVMDALQFELAAEYLLMAAMLAEIKSRMLLPRSESNEDEEEDPRAELIRRLMEYERFKRVAEDIDQLPRMGRDTFQASANAPEFEQEKAHPDVSMQELLVALSEVLRRADMFEHHQVQREQLSTRERMSQVLEKLALKEQFVPFVSLFDYQEGRLGVVVTFLAVMELIKESLVEIVQTESYGPIHVKAKTGSKVSHPEGEAEEPSEVAE